MAEARVLAARSRPAASASRVAVEAKQPARGAQARQDGAAVAATAEGAIDITAIGAER